MARSERYGDAIKQAKDEQEKIRSANEMRSLNSGSGTSLDEFVQNR